MAKFDVNLLVITLVDLVILLSALEYDLYRSSEEAFEGSTLIWTCNITLPDEESRPAGVRFFLNKEKVCTLLLTGNKCEQGSGSEYVDCFCADKFNTTFILNITVGRNHTGHWSCGDLSLNGVVSSSIYLNVTAPYIGTLLIRIPTILPPSNTRSPTEKLGSTSTPFLTGTLPSTQAAPSPAEPATNYNYIYILVGLIFVVLCLTILCSIVVVRKRKRKVQYESRYDQASFKLRKRIQDDDKIDKLAYDGAGHEVRKNGQQVEIIENDLYEGSDAYFVEQNSQVEITKNEV